MVSPVLFGESGYRKVRQVIDVLLQLGAKVNDSCGLHIHIDGAGIDAPYLANIIKRYSKYEKQIDLLMSPERRGNQSYFCKSVNNINIRNTNSIDAIVNMAYNDKYYKINAKSFEDYGTVEFRHHHATLNSVEIVNWIKFIQAFVAASNPNKKDECNVEPKYSRNEQNILDILLVKRKHNYFRHNLRKLATKCNIHLSSCKTYISNLRRKGHVIDCRDSQYKYMCKKRVKPIYIDSLWKNIDKELVSYYKTVSFINKNWVKDT